MYCIGKRHCDDSLGKGDGDMIIYFKRSSLETILGWITPISMKAQL
jgi:hypothetical protein